VPEVLKVPKAAQEHLAALVAAKAKAASAGDMKALRHIDLQIRLMRIKYGLVGKHGNTVRVTPPPHVQAVAHARRAAEVKALTRLGVPAWFRPGYRDVTRVRLWRRLSPQYRAYLIKKHKMGAMGTYLPSLSYLAAQNKVSQYVVATATAAQMPDSIRAQAAGDIVTVVSEAGPDLPGDRVTTDNVSSLDLAQGSQQAALELLDDAQALAAEQQDEESLDATLEPAGEGLLADEVEWYNDPTKLLIAGLGAIVVISALRR
jgi:hypothetical protein